MDLFKRFFLSFVLGIFLIGNTFAFAEEPKAKLESGNFKTMEGEILEVEELKEPMGSAIFTVKDLVTGKNTRFFVDPYLSLINSGAKRLAATEVLGGSKATIIYQDTPEREIPEIIFAKVSGSYY